MPELRKDPIIRRWVVIAKERAKRPSDFRQKAQPEDDAFCPFCEGNEDKTPPEILAYRKAGTEPDKPGWWVRVIPNKFPALDSEGNIRKSGVGMYDLMNGIGVHEVFVETLAVVEVDDKTDVVVLHVYITIRTHVPASGLQPAN